MSEQAARELVEHITKVVVEQAKKVEANPTSGDIYLLLQALDSCGLANACVAAAGIMIGTDSEHGEGPPDFLFAADAAFTQALDAVEKAASEEVWMKAVREHRREQYNDAMQTFAQVGGFFAKR